MMKFVPTQWAMQMDEFTVFVLLLFALTQGKLQIQDQKHGWGAHVGAGAGAGAIAAPLFTENSFLKRF